VDLAWRESPALRVAALQSAEAASRVAVARSATRPQVSMRASNSYATSSLQGLGLDIPGLPDQMGPFQQFDLRPTFTQNVLAPVLRHQVRVAAETAAGERWHEQSSREAVALDVIHGYLGVLEIEARLQSATARLTTADALLADTRTFVEVGTASRLDEARSVIRVEMERAAVTDLEAERDTRRMMLLALMGLPPTRSLTLSDQLSAPTEADRPPAPPPAPLNERPELSAAQAERRAAVAERRRAEAERLPVLAVSGDVGLFGQSVGSHLRTYSVRATVSLPLYEGGRINAAVRSAALRTLQADESMRRVRLQIDTDVQVAGVELQGAVTAHASAVRAVTAARSALELARARFANGLSTNLDVIDAQETLAVAEGAEISRRYGFCAARARLARAQGQVLSVLDEWSGAPRQQP
jgi:outer membrane protein TolC